MLKPFEEELARLERRPVHECCWRAAMWRRSYDVALNATASLEDRLKKARANFEEPAQFFYPSEKNDRY